MVLLSYFSRYGTWRTDVRMFGQSRDNQNFRDRWVTKFSKVWGSTRVPSVHRSSVIMQEKIKAWREKCSCSSVS